MNDRREGWGVPRFQDVLRAAAGRGANAAVDEVRSQLVRFIGYELQYDDMTLLVLQRSKGDT